MIQFLYHSIDVPSMRIIIHNLGMYITFHWPAKFNIPHVLYLDIDFDIHRNRVLLLNYFLFIIFIVFLIFIHASFGNCNKDNPKNMPTNPPI